jgi:hypothetical protein
MNMRIGVLVAGVLIAATSGGSAQVMGGIMGGATYSDFENPDTDSRWGFTGGIFAGVASRGAFTALEVSYTQKGGIGTGPNTPEARIDYIETAITGGAIVGGTGGARGRFYGGIGVAFDVACESEGAAGALFCEGAKVEWNAPLGLMFGKYSPNGTFVGLDVRYTFPLSDASIEVYNNMWMFRLVLGRAKTRR